jgi:antitoxin FitA
MLAACFYRQSMATMIQIRNVPDALHRRLKARAALAGMSLSDYLLQEIRDVAERPTLEGLRRRLESRTKIRPSISPADAIRAQRDLQ